MADPFFNYLAPENHVEKRAGLSEQLKAQLHDPLPDGTQYHGEAAFWLQIHQGLLRSSSILPNWCEQALAERSPDRLHLMSPRICDLATQLVHHAHQHHHIEDDHFFPVFLQAFPQLANPLDLLEKDHVILSAILDDVENATKNLTNISARRDPLFAKGQQDLLMRRIEKLQKSAARLDQLFIRHICDEEEICLPALLEL